MSQAKTRQMSVPSPSVQESWPEKPMVFDEPSVVFGPAPSRRSSDGQSNFGSVRRVLAERAFLFGDPSSYAAGVEEALQAVALDHHQRWDGIIEHGRG